MLRRTGFTLAELLIALAILGVIATFTIPKIINAQADSRNKAIAKEIISTVSNAAYVAQMNGGLSTTSTFDALTPYMNYVAVDTTSTLDDAPGAALGGAPPCAAPYKCLRLHNGASLWYSTTQKYNAYSPNRLYALIDPDGQNTSKNDSLVIIVYYNGQVTDMGAFWGTSTYTPTWFSW